MCQTTSLQTSSELDRRSAPSDTSSLLETFEVLDLDLCFTVFHGYRSGCGALPLF